MRPLDDIVVVDLSRVLSGPICSMLMADMGATVIKVEPPPAGDDTRQWGPPFVGGISTYFHSINRNKRSLGINLKTDVGRGVVWKLIDRADVLIENFRPGVLDKLGFSFDAVSRRNPRTVYCSISGFGQTGPYRSRPAYDVITQGESGLMDLTGYPGEPPAKVGASIADIVAGLYALNGILLALLARHRTGKGQWVDISLLDSTVSTLTYQALIYLSTGRSPQRMGGQHPSLAPYELFEAADGFVNIGVTNPKQWIAFCQALGLERFVDDPRFRTMKDRVANYAALRPEITPILLSMTREDILKKMDAAGVPAGPVNSVAEILEDPQIQARDMVQELIHPEYGPLRMLGIPIKLSDTPGSLDTAPPRFGQHNAEILRDLGYEPAAVEAMAKEGVISAS